MDRLLIDSEGNGLLMLLWLFLLLDRRFSVVRLMFRCFLLVSFCLAGCLAVWYMDDC